MITKVQLHTNGIKRVNFYNINFLGIKTFNFSAFSYSDNRITGRGTFSRSELEKLSNPNFSDRLSDLQLIRYNQNVVKEELTELNIYNYAESFPWFYDGDGKTIDYNKPIKLFNGIKLISNYLEKKYGMDSNLISDVKISELIKPSLLPLTSFFIFYNKKNWEERRGETNGELTVLELYNHVSSVYNKDKDNFNKVFDVITSEAPNVSEANNNLVNIFNSSTSKPFGKFGDITLNEIGDKLKNLKREVLIQNTELTLHTVPLVFNFVSFSLILKGYMKFVHNKPFDPNLNRLYQAKVRNIQLYSFLIFGAPIIFINMNKSAMLFKEVATINLPLNNYTDYSTDKNSSNLISNKGSLFLILSNLNKKIPLWLKVLLKFLLLSIVVIKLLGFNSIFYFFINIYYLKIYAYITGLLVILFQILNLYLLYKFSKKTIKISEILPEFLIDWLKIF